MHSGRRCTLHGLMYCICIKDTLMDPSVLYRRLHCGGEEMQIAIVENGTLNTEGSRSGGIIGEQTEPPFVI